MDDGRFGWVRPFSILALLWAKFPSLLLVLMAMMVLDWATGFAAAAYAGKVSSRKANRGAWGKVAKLCGAVAAYAMGNAVPDIRIGNLPVTPDVGSVCCSWFIWSEFVSVLCNLSSKGLLPPRVESILVSADEHGRPRLYGDYELRSAQSNPLEPPGRPGRHS